MKVVVMGVLGSGKTTLGVALAREMGINFVDADDLHSAENVAHMASGRELSEEMHWPWLDKCAKIMNAEGDVVLACSALRRSHRNYLRDRMVDMRLVFPRVTEEAVRARLNARRGYFVQKRYIASQFEALEPPSADEGAVLIPSTLPIARAAQLAATILSAN